MAGFCKELSPQSLSVKLQKSYLDELIDNCDLIPRFRTKSMPLMPGASSEFVGFKNKPSPRSPLTMVLIKAIVSQDIPWPDKKPFR